MNIGLIGKFGSGKTTVAKYLESKYGFHRKSLADPMRHIVKDIFGVESKTDPRYRRLMQKLGTDWFRSEDPDCWVRYLLNHLDMYQAVVDDVRFPNEAKALSENGWVLIYLDCSDEVRRQRCTGRDGHFDESTLNHPSETGVDEILNMGLPIHYIDANNKAEIVFELIDEVMKEGV